MAIKITDDCINCGACEPECPNNAIYPGDEGWKYSDGTDLAGDIVTPQGLSLDANKLNYNGGFSEEYFYISTNKCTECKGFYDEPQCAAVCPVDCCIDDEDHVETEQDLLSKKKWMHK